MEKQCALIDLRTFFLRPPAQSLQFSWFLQKIIITWYVIFRHDNSSKTSICSMLESSMIPTVEEWLVKVMEKARMVKLMGLIREKTLEKINTNWKPFVHFYKKEKKSNYDIGIWSLVKFLDCLENWKL